MRRAAEKSIPTKGNTKEKKPRWSKVCNEAVQADNSAYRQLRKSATTVKQVWSMIHQIAGINRGLPMLVLMEGNEEVISNGRDISRDFQEGHSTSSEGQLRKKNILGHEGHLLEINTDNSDGINVFFSLICNIMEIMVTDQPKYRLEQVIKLYDAGVRGRMLNWIRDFSEILHYTGNSGGESF